jgi:hypothetical protein
MAIDLIRIAATRAHAMRQRTGDANPLISISPAIASSIDRAIQSQFADTDWDALTVIYTSRLAGLLGVVRFRRWLHQGADESSDVARIAIHAMSTPVVGEAMETEESDDLPDEEGDEEEDEEDDEPGDWVADDEGDDDDDEDITVYQLVMGDTITVTGADATTAQDAWRSLLSSHGSSFMCGGGDMPLLIEAMQSTNVEGYAIPVPYANAVETISRGCTHAQSNLGRYLGPLAWVVAFIGIQEIGLRRPSYPRCVGACSSTSHSSGCGRHIHGRE